MNKTIAYGIIAIALFATPLSFAQAYYPAQCVSISTGLTAGSKGSAVTELQNFLVSQNYPGGGSWMVTGNFGAATAAALRNFQSLQGLAQTGMTDAATVAAISRVSCGLVTTTAPTVYPNTYPTIPFNYSTNYTYPSSVLYYGGTTAITSLSQNTGGPGTVLTIYGVGFDQWNNTVNFGSTVLTGVASQNGSSLTITVPSTYYAYSFAGTSVEVSVRSSHGISNTVSFTVIGNPYNTCGAYNSIYCGGCSTVYPYNYNASCYTPNTVNPVVNYLSPISGGVGTLVTVYGSGFSATNNSVNFGTGIIANLASSDGRAVSFTVPSQLTGYGSQPVTLSTYQVSVTNSSGVRSNAVPFTVTSLTSNGAPTITSVSGPTNLQPGVQGAWTVLINTQGNQYLTLTANWGDQGVYSSAPTTQQIYGYGQQTNTLTHTYTSAGTYTISFIVIDNVGRQNSFTTTVTVGGSTTNNLTIYSVSPMVAPVGTQVVIQGQGFSQYDNTVHFGNGGMMHVPSVNGTTIYYTIPAYITPCDVQISGTICAMYAQQVTRGWYPMYVSNAQGNSNTINFNVQ